MKKNINNKGFTLVELLAVMVILISISLVAVVGITSSLDRRDKKEKEEQIELAVNAAKIYFSLESGNCVKIDDLVNEDYLSLDKIERLNKDFSIAIVNESGSLVYNYQQSCPN